MSSKPENRPASRPSSLKIEQRIYEIRGQRIILDSDLAELYGVHTKRLNEQVKRNRNRFPSDFMFQLTFQEVSALRSQIATSNPQDIGIKGGKRYLPYAFTEYGAVMAANILNSENAVFASIQVVRALSKASRHVKNDPLRWNRGSSILKERGSTT